MTFRTGSNEHERLFATIYGSLCLARRADENARNRECCAEPPPRPRKYAPPGLGHGRPACFCPPVGVGDRIFVLNLAAARQRVYIIEISWAREAPRG